MALNDILAQAGDKQNFILEIPVGTLGTPNDILVEAGSQGYPVDEIPAAAGGGGNIFIMSE